MSDRVFICEYFETYFDEVPPKEFYRALFPVGELEKHDERQQGKYNAIAIELLPKAENNINSRKYIVTDELDILDKLLQSENFIILSPISYIGKSRQANNARYIYAMAIDLDGITEQHYLVDLMHQIEIGFLPKPTYIVWSGTGIHLYYQFTSPLPCFKNIVKQLQSLKKELTKKIWNGYVTEQNEQPQLQSLFQGFRLCGGVTKGGNRTKAFDTGEKVTIEYLNEFVPKEAQVTEYAYKSKLTVKEAEKKYPEWYQKRIIENKRRGTWQANRAVYDWWKTKLHENITEGHRYYGIMVLSIYAKKCGIEKQELETDAFGLIEEMEKLTVTADNHFTREDVLAALEMFNDNYITFPIDSITQLTAIPIEKNKRNGRKQQVHLEYARGIREIKKKIGEEISGGGRPNKKQIILEWKKNNIHGNIKECMADTGLSRSTVYKYWNTGECADE